MDRRGFFKACAGIIAGVVLLPKELPLRTNTAIRTFEKNRPINLDKVRAAFIMPPQHKPYIRTPSLIGERAQAFADWAKHIRDGSAKEYLRQRHKVG